jgi:hypothetical protein
MGKTVYIPDPTSSNAGPSISCILRKVQLITNSPDGVGASLTTGTDPATGGYYTGYIKLAGNTFGGGSGDLGTNTGNATMVARLN